MQYYIVHRSVHRSLHSVHTSGTQCKLLCTPQTYQQRPEKSTQSKVHQHRCIPSKGGLGGGREAKSNGNCGWLTAFVVLCCHFKLTHTQLFFSAYSCEGST